MASGVSVSGGNLRTPVGSAPVIPLVIIGTGIYLTWFSIHYWKRGGWPTAPVKSILQGKGVPAPGAVTPSPEEQAVETSAQQIAAAESQLTAQQGVTPGTGQSNPNAVGQAVASGAGGAVLSNSQIQALWTSNGGDPKTAAFAAAIAEAESSGSTVVTSSNPDGGTNVGLYQLDTRGVGAGYSVAQLQDATTNTRITIMATANGTNWSSWGDSVAEAVGGHYTPGSPVP